MPAKDPEARKAYARRWYVANRQRVQDNVDKWRRENREHDRRIRRDWYAKNAAKICKRQRKRYKLNLRAEHERSRQYRRRRIKARTWTEIEKKIKTLKAKGKKK